MAIESYQPPVLITFDQWSGMKVAGVSCPTDNPVCICTSNIGDAG